MSKVWKTSRGMDVQAGTSEIKSEIPKLFQNLAAQQAKQFHCQMDGYEKTRLVRLENLANQLGVKDIFVKDESERFGLNAFMGLGGTYAMFCILCEKLGLNPEEVSLTDLKTEKAQKVIRDMVFVTATDGNHGRGVSWAGGIFGCQVHVYMPEGSAEVRAEAIRKAGLAKVTITDMNYDQTVSYAKEQSDKNGWCLIQDTAWEGYEQIPSWIVQGYLTMALEITEELETLHIKPTHLFLQAGVGAMAGGMLGYFTDYYGAQKPVVVVVEPQEANCVYRSVQIADGELHQVDGNPVTIMAGLNCGTPCGITWPILRDYVEYYISCKDYVAAHGMRRYAMPVGEDEKIVSGESGAVTLGVLDLLLTDEDAKDICKQMGLNKDSVILLINTEGDTDPTNYIDVVENGAYPVEA